MNSDFDKRVSEVFAERYDALVKQTDHLFGWLFIFQWLLGITFALLISPKAWTGEASQTHIHVYAAVFLGGLVAALPVYLVFKNPGATFNRMVVSVSQILFSILFIHLTGGRIETHFHVFGSLAFLAFYRDWRTVVIATVITAGDHLIRGAFWPQSVYGVLSATPWRAFEHAAWVLFEDLILFYSIAFALKELRSVSESQVRLEIALDDAEKAYKVKSQFLANVSHELRTPMHGILSYARFGQQKIDSSSKEKLKSYFDEIHESGSRLMNLLNDLLDLSKLESGKLVYSMQEGDMVVVAKGLESEMAAYAFEKKLRMQFNSWGEVNGVFDGEKIAQVLRNLLSNAIKFSERGSTIQVDIGATPEMITCCVSNRGLGIPESELEFIFDKFMQSSKTRTGAGGTGLGLAICREIIKHHGGRIWAESEPNGETRFHFEFPRVAAKTEERVA